MRTITSVVVSAFCLHL